MGSIQLQGVTKRFGDTIAVDAVDLDIADGEFVVLVGPSGCGKSTLLRMIAGLEETSEGSIVIDGQDATDLAPRERDLAMVFQNYALYPHMTVAQNLAFGLEARKTDKAQARTRVQEVAKTLRLEALIKRKPRELSGGQRQRVAMGRAMVRQPRAYLMDEPLSNLDAKLRTAMRTELSRLHERVGVTTIYVTHDQVEAMTLGDRVVVLRDGVLQQVDTPAGLFGDPVNVFVAGFIGSPSINLAEATFDGARLGFGDIRSRRRRASICGRATPCSWVSGRATSRERRRPIRRWRASRCALRWWRTSAFRRTWSSRWPRDPSKPSTSVASSRTTSRGCSPATASTRSSSPRWTPRRRRLPGNPWSSPSTTGPSTCSTR
jgi:ABC-type sugar transport system ATPase subunit